MIKVIGAACHVTGNINAFNFRRFRLMRFTYRERYME